MKKNVAPKKSVRRPAPKKVAIRHPGRAYATPMRILPALEEANAYVQKGDQVSAQKIIRGLMMKACHDCKEMVFIRDFPKASKGNAASYCKNCYKARGLEARWRSVIKYKGFDAFFRLARVHFRLFFNLIAFCKKFGYNISYDLNDGTFNLTDKE